MTKRKEYGDFQTPIELAQQALELVQREFRMKWSRILEPTCGLGHFIQATVNTQIDFQEIIGIEIQSDYIQQARHIGKPHTHIEIIQGDIFTLDCSRLQWNTKGNLLVIGNPPWVTNAELSTLGSNNVPQKSNFKQEKGLDALTGKANFDVAEFIWIKLLRELQTENTLIALLCKTSVARKVFKHCYEQKLPVTDTRIYRIDAAKWFGAAVDACLLIVALGTASPTYQLKVYKNFTSLQPETTIGFHQGQLVSDWETFQRLQHFHGQCPIEWRQGVKHDAASVLELERTELGWMNKLGHLVDVETQFCYPLLKSSDIRPQKTTDIDKVVILPQHRLGENTSLLEKQAPCLWHYLKQHQAVFQQRKSSIYRNKSEFAIFGIGEYTFAAYKVLVSGFYKKPYFLPVMPFNDKPVVCDDTVYLLPCTSLMQAILVASILNHEDVQAFIQSLAFSDSKRPITKTLLQMLDLEAMLEYMPLADLHKSIREWAKSLTCDPQQIVISPSKSDYQHLIARTYRQLQLL